MMPRGEIAQRFRDAKNKPQQIKILAELNDCPVQVIQEELMEAGYSPDEVRIRKNERRHHQTRILTLKTKLELFCEYCSESMSNWRTKLKQYGHR